MKEQMAIFIDSFEGMDGLNKLLSDGWIVVHLSPSGSASKWLLILEKQN